MKANEFVKKFGWDKAKEVAGFTSNVCEDPTHFVLIWIFMFILMISKVLWMSQMSVSAT